MSPRTFWIIILLSGVVILGSGAMWVSNSLAMLNADCHPWLKRCQITDDHPQPDAEQKP